MRRTLLFTLACLLGIVSVKAQTSGDTGDVKWAYADGTLTISGTGAMADYVELVDRGWDSLAEDIETVIIGDGVTVIGSGVFQGFEKLKTVIIGSGVKTINNHAFNSNSAITKMTVLAETPPTLNGSSIFDDVPTNIVINVPYGKESAYAESLKWNIFSNFKDIENIEINNLADLKEFRNSVNAGISYSGLTVTLQVDKIDLKDEDWVPIGEQYNLFKGTFDGNGYTILNLTISGANSIDNRGLFGVISGATIKNLNLENVAIDAYTTSAGTNTGAIVGYTTNNSTIENCHVTSGVINSITNNTGGLVGRLGYGKMVLCSNNANLFSADVTNPADISGGGLVGFAEGDIERSFNKGKISANTNKTQFIGGLVGQAFGKITNSYNIGEIDIATTITWVVTGGIAGKMPYGGSITNCYSYANITVGTYCDAGGLVGNVSQNATVSDCLALSKSMTGGEYENRIYILFGAVSTIDVTLSDNYSWLKGMDTSDYGEKETGTLWSGTMDSNPFSDWDGSVWEFDFDNDLIMPKLKDISEAIQPDIKNPLATIKISDVDELIAFRDEVNKVGGKDYSGETVELVADNIDLAELEDWTPIGTATRPFTGTFKGNGNTISNLTIPAANTNGYRGLFGFIRNATIEELILEEVTIDARTNISGGTYTGAIAGQAELSDVINCHVISGTIKDSYLGKATYTGGLVGYLFLGEMRNCSNSATVLSEGVGSEDSYIGGLVGYLSRGKLYSCFNQGKVSGKGALDGKPQYIGGLVGMAKDNANTPVIVTDSYNLGNINVEVANNNQTVYAGGIVGYFTDENSSSEINKCYSYADITGGTLDKSYTGGVFGGNLGAGTIADCLSLSENLTGKEGQTGFLCGDPSSTGYIGGYTWVKGAKADEYYDGKNNKVMNGFLWSGAMDSAPFYDSWDDVYVWEFDFDNDLIMPKLKGIKFVTQPDIKNALKDDDDSGSTPSGSYHTLTLEVAPGIDLNGLTAGNHQVEEGGHLHLQFLPEDPAATAADILLLIDGVETSFSDLGSGNYFSYILNPVGQDHTILIAMREYAVTLPETEGVIFDVGAGDHWIAFGEKFTFTLTLADGIDPANVHVYVNGLEISPTNLPQGEALRASVLPISSPLGGGRQGALLTYTIDKVTGPITVVIEGTGEGTTGNANIADGGIQLRITNYELQIENATGQAVDVAVYTVAGQNVVSLRGLRGSQTITLAAGIYIVKAGNEVRKVVIP